MKLWQYERGMMDPFSSMADSINSRILHVVASMRSLFAFAHCGQRSLSAADCESIVAAASPDLIASIKSNGVNTIQATALVFVHSSVENAVFELLGFVLRWDSAAAFEVVKNKQVSLELAKTQSHQDLQETLLADYLEKVEQFPLPKKVATLLSILKPATVNNVITGFSYDKDRLVEIDNERHKIVHEPSFSKEVENINEKLQYFKKVLQLLVELSKRKYSGTIPGGSFSPTPPTIVQRVEGLLTKLSKKAQLFVARNLLIAHALWIFFIVYYFRYAASQHDPIWVSRAGGLMAFVGLFMMTLATARSDEKLTDVPISQDKFYVHGFVVSAIGTLIWAVGDSAASSLGLFQR